MPHTRTLALWAGSLYLVTHVTSVAAAFAYTAGIADTSVDLLRLGITLELALAIACVANGTVLLAALRPVGPAAAYTFAGLRTLEAAIIGAGILPMLALVFLLSGAIPGSDLPITTSPDGAFVASLAGMHAASFLVGQGLVIGVNTLVLSWLLWRSRAVVRGIPLLGAVGATLVLLSDVAQLFGVIEQSNVLVGLAAAPIFAFELWFAGYLLFVGFRPRIERAAVAESVPVA
jgi:hypothetical protein